MSTELKTFKTLKAQSELMLRASRKNDKAITKDSLALSPLIVDYMHDVKDNAEWSLARITATIYDAVGYDSKAVDKQGESMKSPSFETRVKERLLTLYLSSTKLTRLQKQKNKCLMKMVIKEMTRAS